MLTSSFDWNANLSPSTAQDNSKPFLVFTYCQGRVNENEHLEPSWQKQVKIWEPFVQSKFLSFVHLELSLNLFPHYKYAVIQQLCKVEEAWRSRAFTSSHTPLYKGKPLCWYFPEKDQESAPYYTLHTVNPFKCKSWGYMSESNTNFMHSHFRCSWD